MNCTKVDLDKWDRGELFRFYMDQMRIVMSLTVDIDVAPLLHYVKARSLKFYPAMIWVVSKVINAHDEFKYGWNEDGELIRWDFVSPSYTGFNGEMERFSKFVTEYTDDFADFYCRAAADLERHRTMPGFAEKQPPNFFDLSCLPWVRYRHFDVHVFDQGKFLAPVVTWGKYEAQDGKALMPLSMNIHHAVADGFHLSRFFNEVQEIIDRFAP